MTACSALPSGGSWARWSCATQGSSNHTHTCFRDLMGQVLLQATYFPYRDSAFRGKKCYPCEYELCPASGPQNTGMASKLVFIVDMPYLQCAISFTEGCTLCSSIVTGKQRSTSSPGKGTQSMVPLQLFSHPCAGAQKEFKQSYLSSQTATGAVRKRLKRGAGHKICRVNTASLLTSNNSAFFFWTGVLGVFPWY